MGGKWLIIETEVMTEYSSHVEEELLEQYSVGCLAESQVARVEEHVLLCEACQDKLEQIDSWIMSVRRAGARLPAESKNLWQFWKLPQFVPALAAIALLVLAAGVGLEITHKGAVTPLAITLEVTRGESVASVPAGKPLLLQPGLEGLPRFAQYRLEVVDQSGHSVRQAKLQTGSSVAGTSIPGITVGVYFVRVYSPSGELLREYGIEAK
jgi:hypothetical protein